MTTPHNPDTCPKCITLSGEAVASLARWYAAAKVPPLPGEDIAPSASAKKPR